MLYISEPQEIVVIASREETDVKESPASITVIDRKRIDRLGEPLAAGLLRLVPSAAVAISGPSGSLTEVRIRGAEADHTLLFVDGIRANDPAAGNAPRFELLNADLAGRMEIVRGPQSALWGADAIGGVVAVGGMTSAGTDALVEAGSFGSLRGAARTMIGDKETGLVLAAGAQRSLGVDSFDGRGDRDGYDNRSVRAAGRAALGGGFSLDGAAFHTRSASDYDGYVGWVRGDTLDSSVSRLSAARVGLRYGTVETVEVRVDASLLGSRNAYFLADDFLTAATGRRRSASAQAGFPVGKQRFVVALDAEKEDFAGELRATRRRQAAALEWRGRLGPVRTDVALRRDLFSDFADATTLRASALVPIGRETEFALTYGEGIAQPTFYDLFGYPGFSVGNRALVPERSRGSEASLRWSRGPWRAAATLWRQRLTDEIVADYSGAEPSTANALGESRRKGIELEGGFAPGEALRLTAAYALVDADEPYLGTRRTELRRPRHSGHVALDGTHGPWTYGAMVSRTGLRRDFDYDAFVPVALPAYWLVGGQVRRSVARSIELTARIANALGKVHEDVFGYRSEGRSVHGGIRVRLDR